ncbi:unnamed protein product, partial [marine sediment metagenome]
IDVDIHSFFDVNSAKKIGTLNVLLSSLLLYTVRLV